MTILLQRLCWNSQGWRGPTGEKYGEEGSYVGKNGFGHEEWNFNTADLINGKVYGYTYYNPPAGGVIPLGPHSIFFFTIAPGKERLLVGGYQNAHFLTPMERRQLRMQLEGSDVLDRRAEELVALGMPKLSDRSAALEHLLQDFALNVHTSPQDVLSFSPPRILQSEDTGGRNPLRLNRYTKPVFLEEPPASATNEDPDAIQPHDPPPEDLFEDSYVRFTTAKKRVIVCRHNLLSNRFKNWLVSVHATEINTEAQSVDTTCLSEGQVCLFELKTCHSQSTRHALREALGQLLEYAYYPGRPNSKWHAVVLDAAPSETDIQWFTQLAKIQLPVELFWLVGEDVFTAKLTKHPLVNKANALKPKA